MSERARTEAQVETAVEVAIIGAGFGGLGLAIRLQQEGCEDFLILEQGDEIGGVWRDNRYPGASCDVPSHLYSFSFEPNPDWERMFGTSEEIYRYLRYCADTHDLYRRLRFNTRVEAMSFDEGRGDWLLRTADGGRLRARLVVPAIGALNRPAWPAIAGLDRFRGTLLHTAQWDPAFDPRGRRVAVIGTGASAIQVVPALQPGVAALKVFQRTPPWVLPRRDRPIGGAERRWYRRLPLLQWLYRQYLFWVGEAVTPIFLRNGRLTRLVEKLARRYLRSEIADPELRRRLTPDYALGCKRVLLSDDYYPALSRGNVELVTEPVAALTEHEVVTRDGRRYPVDAVVMATGFQVPSAGVPFEIRGLGGRLLAEDWREAAEAYLGMAVSGYPNMLFIMGPNTGPGNQSVIFYIEAQINYILQYLRSLRGLKYLDVRRPVQEGFNARLQQRMRGTTWLSGCNSWYLTRDGRNTTLWPGFASAYYLRTRRFSSRAFHAVPQSAQSGVGETEHVSLERG